MKFRLLGAAAAIVVVAILLGIIHWRFGSVTNTIAYFDGKTVVVDMEVRDLGPIEKNKVFKVPFTFVNLRSEPLKIVGANASCSCVIPPNIPITLQPFAPTPVVFNFESPPDAQEFAQEINIYFDGPTQAMLLKIIGATR